MRLYLYIPLSCTRADHCVPPTGFNAPFWRRLSLAALALAIYLRAAPDDLADQVEHLAEQKLPWVTRYIEHNLSPDADKFKERNDRHLELAKQAADDKLLFQEAERPRVRRMRYLGCVPPRSLSLCLWAAR